MNPRLPHHTQHLGKDLCGCREENALLASETSLQVTGGMLPKPHQKIWGFNPDVKDATLESIRSAETDPLPYPETESENQTTLELEGTTFQAHPDGYWFGQWIGCDIRILPNTSRSETIRLLTALAPIEKNLLRRGFPDRQPTIIRIGSEQKEYNIASASINNGNHLFFPKAPGTCNLMAVHTEKACGIELEKIILHEIGHFLEPFLADETIAIRDHILSRFGELEPLLKQISPHYLGGDWYSTLKNKAETLNTAQRKGLDTILVDGSPKDAEQVITEQRNWFTAEITAEVTRYFLLEPLLHNQAAKRVQCSWTPLNRLINKLLQANQRDHNRPLFPSRTTTKENPGQDILEI